MTRKTLEVSGMVCNGCEDNVVNALLEIGGVSAAEASQERDEVEVTLDREVEETELASAISDAGYELTG